MSVFNRARPLVILVVAAFLFGTLGLLSAAPARASDMAGPVLVSQSVTTANLNLYNGPATIYITIHLRDDTGVQTPTMTASWVNPDPWAWGGGQSQGFGSMRLASGTMKDGVWKHTITIPQGAATGQWAVKLYPLRDTWGNNSAFFQTLKTVTVTDEAPPTAVTPAAVTFTDKNGTTGDTYTVPTKTGIQYLVDGKVVSAGTYPGAGKVTVTAKARTGYVLAPNAPSSWTLTFKGLLAGSTPTISGTGQVGSALMANPGSWGPSPVTLEYQWYRSGVAIAGANAGTYTLVRSRRRKCHHRKRHRLEDRLFDGDQKVGTHRRNCQGLVCRPGTHNHRHAPGRTAAHGDAGQLGTVAGIVPIPVVPRRRNHRGGHRRHVHSHRF